MYQHLRVNVMLGVRVPTFESSPHNREGYVGGGGGVRWCWIVFQWGGRVVRWCWVNFQCLGVLLIWSIVGQGPSVLAEVVGGGCLDIFIPSITSLFFLPLWETIRYRLKYCLKRPLSQKQPSKVQKKKINK